MVSAEAALAVLPEIRPGWYAWRSGGYSDFVATPDADSAAFLAAGYQYADAIQPPLVVGPVLDAVGSIAGFSVRLPKIALPPDQVSSHILAGSYVPLPRPVDLIVPTGTRLWMIQRLNGPRASLPPVGLDSLFTITGPLGLHVEAGTMVQVVSPSLLEYPGGRPGVDVHVLDVTLRGPGSLDVLSASGDRPWPKPKPARGDVVALGGSIFAPPPDRLRFRFDEGGSLPPDATTGPSFGLTLPVLRAEDLELADNPVQVLYETGERVGSEGVWRWGWVHIDAGRRR